MKYLAAILLLVACNPVKQVQRDPVKTLKVVDWYLQQNPLVNDTVWNTVKGTPIVEIKEDTISLFDTDSFYVDRYHTITKTITKTRVDTLVKTIYDNRINRELQRGNSEKVGQITQLNEQVKAIGKKANNWKYRFIGLLALIILGLGIGAYLKFKK